VVCYLIGSDGIHVFRIHSRSLHARGTTFGTLALSKQKTHTRQDFRGTNTSGENAAEGVSRHDFGIMPLPEFRNNDANVNGVWAARRNHNESQLKYVEMLSIYALLNQ
jgi:hypothetical protein